MATSVDVLVVYQKEGILATFDDKKGVLYVGLASCPSNDELDKMWIIISTFVIHYPDSVIIHLAHIESSEFEPPDINVLLHLVTKIVTDFSDVGKKCKKVIIQPKKIDEKVIFAQQIFRGLMGSKLDLIIEDQPKVVNELISNLLSQETRTTTKTKPKTKPKKNTV